MAVLKLKEVICDKCSENLYLVNKEKLTIDVDENRVARIMETWRCANGHTRNKLYADKSKLIVN